MHNYIHELRCNFFDSYCVVKESSKLLLLLLPVVQFQCYPFVCWIRSQFKFVAWIPQTPAATESQRQCNYIKKRIHFFFFQFLLWARNRLSGSLLKMNLHCAVELKRIALAKLDWWKFIFIISMADWLISRRQIGNEYWYSINAFKLLPLTRMILRILSLKSNYCFKAFNFDFLLKSNCVIITFT